MEIKQQLFCRYEGNPILKREHWQHIVNAVFNPGAVKLEETGRVVHEVSTDMLG